MLTYLQCPQCHGIAFDREENNLKCKKCGAVFPIIDDIIIFSPFLLETQREKHTLHENTIKKITDVFTNHITQYDAWFEKSKGSQLFSFELDAIRLLLDTAKLERSLEIGVGTGRFASQLGIKFGVDPSLEALKIAKSHGINVVQGIGETLPFKNAVFSLALVVVTICYFNNPKKALQEINRVLTDKGIVLIGFIPADSPFGRLYQQKKQEGNVFYKYVTFYTINQVKTLLEQTNFELDAITSTLTQLPAERLSHEQAQPYLQKNASFVVVRAIKRK